MIMAIPPYIGLSVSILNNNQATYSPSEKGTESKSSEMRKASPAEDGVTLIPKKRSFDVAFLISPDDNKQSKSRKQEVKKFEPATQPDFEIQPCENETIRSAFRKVGMGFSSPSRSPSPIESIRTPSPYKASFPEKKLHVMPEVHRVQKKEPFPCANFIPQRPRFQNYQKEIDKSPIFLGNNLMNPVSVGLTRQNFIPAPIFGANPMLPTSFVNASLLPPSLAALTLPAQNVCAKCNVSFRMTSDLVYHMRSHHKNDHANSDQLRRRREMDKLKCPVCNESFRERHHLTRHMTAHQDKEGDNVDGDANLRCIKGKTVENSRLSGEYDP